MKYRKYIKFVVVVALLSVVLYVLFFFSMFLYVLFFPEEEKCTDVEVSSIIAIRNMNYKPTKGKLYYYKQGSDFRELILSEDLSPFESEKGGSTDLISNRDYHLKLKYDYRLIVDDTICFDLSNYQVKPDTLGRTMGGWAVMCKLTGYNCNGEFCETKLYQVLDPPFDKRRIIKKGIYDK